MSAQYTAWSSTFIDTKDYAVFYWPRLKSAVDHFLEQKPGEPKLSYEEIYSAAYKVVFSRLAERFYKDLIEHICFHLYNFSHSIDSSSETNLVASFSGNLERYLAAVDLMVRVFSYLDRLYVKGVMNSCLHNELMKLFSKIVLQPIKIPLIETLKETRLRPFQINPSIVSKVMNNLHVVDPHICNEYSDLFCAFIPNILPPVVESDLSKLLEETRKWKEQYKATDCSELITQNRKRTYDEVDDN